MNMKENLLEEIALALADSPAPDVAELVDRAARILEGLAADERTSIVRDRGDDARRRLLPKLSEAMRSEVETLLRYPPLTAGGIMTTEFVSLRAEMRVRDALSHIRAVAREKEAIYACYVLDPETSHLLGAVSLRDLVRAELDQPVTEVMRKKPVTVAALRDERMRASTP